MTTPFPAVFGHPPAALAETCEGPIQLSPLVPGSTALEGALARRAGEPRHAGRARHDRAAPRPRAGAARPGARCAVHDPRAQGRRGLPPRRRTGRVRLHASTTGPRRITASAAACDRTRCEGIEEAIAAGAPRLEPGLGLWTQPGVFSWDRLDPGTALLMEALPRLSGKGADLGCGVGVLAHPVLASDAVTDLDTDRHRPPRDRGSAPQRRRSACPARLGGCPHRHARAARFRRDEPAVPCRRRGGQGTRRRVHPQGRREPAHRRPALDGRQQAPALRGHAQGGVQAGDAARRSERLQGACWR